MQVTDQKGNDQTPLGSAFCWKYCRDKKLGHPQMRSSQGFAQILWKADTHVAASRLAESNQPVPKARKASPWA